MSLDPAEFRDAAHDLLTDPLIQFFLLALAVQFLHKRREINRSAEPHPLPHVRLHVDGRGQGWTRRDAWLQSRNTVDSQLRVVERVFDVRNPLGTELVRGVRRAIKRWG